MKALPAVFLILFTHSLVFAKNNRPGAGTPSGVFALYENSLFGNARCLEKAGNPDSVLLRNGIKTEGNPDPAERAALAKGIAQIEVLLGKPLPKEWQTTYVWDRKRTGAWNYGLDIPNKIIVKTAVNRSNGQLTGRMVHELGHKIGSANKGQLYSAYQTVFENNPCHISGYSIKKMHEQFADVFEAYVVNPLFLEAQCPEAFAFFQDKVLKNGREDLATCGGQSPAIKAFDKILTKSDRRQPASR